VSTEDYTRIHELMHVALGCGSEEKVFLIPHEELSCMSSRLILHSC